MKDSIKEILPGVGLGDIRFGMLPNEVFPILGSPNELEIYCYSELPNDKSENWHYEDYELSIGYNEEEGWKLDTISVNSADYHFKQLITINQSLKEVKSNLSTLGYENCELEDWSSSESPDHKLLIVDEIGMNFWFENGKLSEIQWGPLFLEEQNEETVIWPAIERVEGATKLVDLKKYESQYLFSKLKLHLNAWLDKIFDKKSSKEYADLQKDFPAGTTREDLTLESKSINYYLSMEDKAKGSIEAKSHLYHKDEGALGWMSVHWDENLALLDDFLVFE